MADQNSSSTPSDVISQATATDAGSLEVQDRHTHPEKDSKFALLFSIWCAIAILHYLSKGKQSPILRWFSPHYFFFQSFLQILPSQLMVPSQSCEYSGFSFQRSVCPTSCSLLPRPFFKLGMQPNSQEESPIVYTRCPT